jgi:SAM-dependent methyltransferase
MVRLLSRRRLAIESIAQKHTNITMKQALKTFLGRQKTKIPRKFLPGYRRQRGDDAEKQHWSRLFSSKANLFSDPDFENRANPDRLLQPELAKLLPAGNNRPLVLDVGCGPLSTIGIVFSGGRVDLHGADPLADNYRELLAGIQVEPNCKLITCPGQDLQKQLGSDVYDLVTSVNALDHAESPMEVLKNMVAVCKKGGFVYLYHCENEGLHERYRGMHQWNFRKEKDQLVANDGVVSHNMLDGIEGVEIHSERTIPAKPRPFLEWILKKTM